MCVIKNVKSFEKLTRLHQALCLAHWLSEWHSLIKKSRGLHQEIALLEWCMYEITVYSGFLALMSTSLIIHNFSALQIPSITTCCRPLSSLYSTAEEHFITLPPVIILRPAWPSRSIRGMTLKQRQRGG